MRHMIYLYLILSANIFADTIDHFINIANNIPQMEMKADQQSQAWARSARTILILTSESIAETLTIFNDSATQNGNPLFCLPNGTKIEANDLNNLIQQTYKEIYSQQSDKDKMTVSQVALIGIRKKYPCQQKSPIKQQVAMASTWGQ